MKYRLGDICEIVTGSTPKTGVPEYWDGELKWITPAELNDDSYVVNDTSRKLTSLGVQKTGLTSFPAGTVILSSRAPIGKVAIAGCEMYCNQGFKNLICSDKINEFYLFWFLKSKTEYLNSLGRGATFKEISKAILSSVEIELPPIETQNKVVLQLETIRRILNERKEELRQLDELVKARFVELFGNPSINPYGFLSIPVQEAIESGYIEKPLDGNHGNKHPKSSEYVEEGIPFVMANDLVNGRVDFKKCAKLTKERADQLDKGFAHDGDVLITHKGTIGRTAILHTDLDYVMLTPQVTYYRPLKGILAEYLKGYFDSEYFQHKMKQLAEAGGSTRAYVGITNQTQLSLLIPDLDRQKEFVEFIKQVDKSKVVIQKSLDEAQLLFDSLMQLYFS